MRFFCCPPSGGLPSKACGSRETWPIQRPCTSSWLVRSTGSTKERITPDTKHSLWPLVLGHAGRAARQPGFSAGVRLEHHGRGLNACAPRIMKQAAEKDDPGGRGGGIETQNPSDDWCGVAGPGMWLSPRCQSLSSLEPWPQPSRQSFWASPLGRWQTMEATLLLCRQAGPLSLFRRLPAASQAIGIVDRILNSVLLPTNGNGFCSGERLCLLAAWRFEGGRAANMAGKSSQRTFRKVPTLSKFFCSQVMSLALGSSCCLISQSSRGR